MSFFFRLILLSLVSASCGLAEIVRYTDSSGQAHYVEGASKVPEEYRDQIDNNAPLPPINKVRASEYAQAAPAPASHQKVQIFVTSWCPYCKRLEKFLKANNITYTRYDIEENDKAHDMYEQLGGRGVPVIKIGSRVLMGFNPDEIISAVGK